MGNCTGFCMTNAPVDNNQQSVKNNVITDKDMRKAINDNNGYTHDMNGYNAAQNNFDQNGMNFNGQPRQISLGGDNHTQGFPRQSNKDNDNDRETHGPLTLSNGAIYTGERLNG